MGPRALVGLLCAANLAAGIGLGITVDRIVLPHPREHHGHHGPHGPGGPQGGGGREIARLAERLNLDAAQQEQVRAIFAARRPAFTAIMDEVRPRMRALRHDTDAQIRAVLRPDQAARLDELRREWDQADRAAQDNRESRDGGRSQAPVSSGTAARPDSSGAGK